MSPDIEWRIEDDGGQHTVSSPPPRLARPRRWAFAAIIVTGMVCFYLGVYVAQPGQPAPTPAPIVITRLFTQPAAITPESLTEALSRDAAALDPRSLIMTSTAHLDAVYAAWYRSLLQVYSPIEPAYTVIQSGTLTNNTIWLDLTQAVADGSFRSTRFYRQQDNRWTWTLPDPSFWSGAEETLVFDQDWWGMPLKVNYPIEDRALIGETVARIQQVHAQLCAEIRCSGSTPFTLTVVIRPMLQRHSVLARAAELTLTLPSPRILGLSQIYTMNVPPGDPITTVAYDSLIAPLYCSAAGGSERWSAGRDGEIFLQALIDWKHDEVRSDVALAEMFYSSSPTSARDQWPDLDTQSLAPLTDVWHWPHAQPPDDHTLRIMRAEAYAVSVFIDLRFGREAVGKFLRALGSAASLAQALKTSTGLTSAEFEERWLKWLGMS